MKLNKASVAERFQMESRGHSGEHFYALYRQHFLGVNVLIGTARSKYLKLSNSNPVSLDS